MATKKPDPEHNRTYKFRTRPEAKAFQQGVELVNESSIRVVGVKLVQRGTSTRYVALVQDDDFKPDEHDDG